LLCGARVGTKTNLADKRAAGREKEELDEHDVAEEP